MEHKTELKYKTAAGNEAEIEAEKLLEFIAASPSCFHVAANTAASLKAQGFVPLMEQEKWELAAGGRYYVTRNGSSVIAFMLPEGKCRGFQLICSHTDSPAFKIKENPEITVDGKYRKLNVEKYGGMLCAPWFDRPLSVAGRIMVREQAGRECRIRQKLVHADRDLVLIPNLAIHMNREANDGVKYNAQTDLCPLFGSVGQKDSLKELIAQEAGVTEEQILGMDLFLYNRQRGSIWGAAGEFISAPKLDDLQCLYGSLQGFLKSVPGPEHASVFCAFDNEETGSVSRQGAASTFLKDTLQRITEVCGGTGEDYRRAIARSFLVSADNAHAVHPNHPEKADPVNRPVMNGGIVIKYNAGQKYITDAQGRAVFQSICEKAGVPFQVYTNRSDIAGGSTLGNISNTQVSVRGADIGLAQLAMHSPYETAGVRDLWYLEQAAQAFYRSVIRFPEEGMITCSF